MARWAGDILDAAQTSQTVAESPLGPRTPHTPETSPVARRRGARAAGSVAVTRVGEREYATVGILERLSPQDLNSDGGGATAEQRWRHWQQQRQGPPWRLSVEAQRQKTTNSPCTTRSARRSVQQAAGDRGGKLCLPDITSKASRDQRESRTGASAACSGRSSASCADPFQSLFDPFHRNVAQTCERRPFKGSQSCL